MADLAGLAQEGFPGFGQGQLAFAARSLDQLGAVIVLQCFDLGAEGRLGQGQFLEAVVRLPVSATVIKLR